ncbi:MAG: hypothetical protein IJ030_00695 [Oscillospiraceae bacterium]|nr:hypothetical protein [Oscillospiraceae bacterium]MBQ8880678.1 hypothetical protein [Oscillospiraceae bacterium]
MKKWIALMLTLALAMSLSACSCAKQPDAPDGTKPTGTTDPTQTTGSSNGKALPGTMEENINRIMENNPVEFMGVAISVDVKDTSEENLWTLKNYTGLDSAEKLTDVAVYEPMTGSQAFSLVLARVTDAANAETVAREMKEKINPGKWICVQADQVMAAGYGDTVMFIMLDSQLGKTAQSYVDAFAKVCGSKPDFSL